MDPITFPLFIAFMATVMLAAAIIDVIISKGERDAIDQKLICAYIFTAGKGTDELEGKIISFRSWLRSFSSRIDGILQRYIGNIFSLKSIIFVFIFSSLLNVALYTIIVSQFDYSDLSNGSALKTPAKASPIWFLHDFLSYSITRILLRRTATATWPEFWLILDFSAAIFLYFSSVCWGISILYVYHSPYVSSVLLDEFYADPFSSDFYTPFFELYLGAQSVSLFQALASVLTFGIVDWPAGEKLGWISDLKEIRLVKVGAIIGVSVLTPTLVHCLIGLIVTIRYLPYHARIRLANIIENVSGKHFFTKITAILTVILTTSAAWKDII